MKQLLLALLTTVCSGAGFALAQPWPISRSGGENGDVVTSAFGPRLNGGYQLHYGMDLNRPGGGLGDEIRSSFPAVVRDCGLRSGGVGYYLEIDVFEPHRNEVARLKYWHLQANPCAPDGLALRAEQSVDVEEVIGFVGGSGAAANAPHLHLGYFPNSRRVREREDSANPIALFDYDNKSSYDDFRIEKVGVTKRSGDHWLTFDVLVNPRRLDLNEVTVRFEAIDVTGAPRYHDDAFRPSIINSETGYPSRPQDSHVPPVSQVIGRIDFEGRIGYDTGSRPNSSVYNGVSIHPASLANSSPGGYQTAYHRYTIGFDLRDEVLGQLAGGLFNVWVEARSIRRPGLQIEDGVPLGVGDLAVSWTEEWPVGLAAALMPATVVVGDGGRIIVQKEGATEDHHIVYTKTIHVRAGGIFELEEGSSPGDKAWFTNEGTFTVDAGGTLQLGAYATFQNRGTVVNSGTTSSGTEAEFVGNSPEEGETASCVPGCDRYLPRDVREDFTVTRGEWFVSSQYGCEVHGGATLRIEPGAVIRAKEGRGLAQIILVHPGGRILAGGTAAEPITIRHAWEPVARPYLRIRGEHTTSRILHTRFLPSEAEAIVLESGALQVSHAEFRGNRTAIMTSGKMGAFPTLTLTSSRIHEQKGSGLSLNLSNARLTGNVIERNQGNGIYLYRTAIEPFRRNVVEANGSHGLKISSFGAVYASSRSGNRILGNRGHEIYTLNTSGYAELGWSAGTVNEGGYNDIHDSGGYFVYNVARSSYGEGSVFIPAERNYWGSPRPSSTRFFGWVDWWPYLSSPQTASPVVVTAGDLPTPPALLTAGMAEALRRDDGPGHEDGDERTRRKLRALDLRNALRREDASERERAALLTALFRLRQPDEKDMLGERGPLEALLASARLPAGVRLARGGERGLYEERVRLLHAETVLRDDGPAAARARVDALRGQLRNADHRHHLLMVELAAHEDAGDWQAALRALSEAEKIGPEAEMQAYYEAPDYAELREHLIRRLDAEGALEDAVLAEAVVEPEAPWTGEGTNPDVSDGATLSEAYPNPFRDRTTLSLRLVRPAFVEVAVYDVVGRRVASLLDGQRRAQGSYLLEFGPAALPSGPYFVRAHVRDEHGTRILTRELLHVR